MASVTLDAAGSSVREINAALRALGAEGEATVTNPAARHNFAVAILASTRIRIAGSVGYYCAGHNDGARIEVTGSAGWGLAESMLDGHVRVMGSAGSGAAAALRGGTVVIHGDAAARLGVSMKGGTVIVAGNCGYMAGFMAQKGTIVVAGDVGEAFGDSLYATTCYVGGRIGSLGTDAVVKEMEDGERASLQQLLEANLSAQQRTGLPEAGAFQKIVAGRALWNFDQREWKIWQEAL